MIEFLLIIISLLLFCLYLNALTEQKKYKTMFDQLNRINKKIEEKRINNILDLYVAGKISFSQAYEMSEMNIVDFYENFELKKLKK